MSTPAYGTRLPRPAARPAASRRSAARRPLRRQLLFRRVGQSVYSVDRITDVSGGGLFIATDRPLVIGSQIVGVLRADRDGASPPIFFAGEVTWRSSRLAPSLKGPGLGVRFTYLEPASRDRLGALLAP